MTKVALITTTIYVPECLDKYMENAVAYGHKDTLFIVTADKKTPGESRSMFLDAAKKHAVQAIYQTVDDQREWLKHYPELGKHIPWGCIQRRNLAILKAYEEGCDVIITIDDDNLCIEGQDFIGDHVAALGDQDMDVLSSSSGWLNVCAWLRDKRGYTFYPRGYPMKQRWPAVPPIVRHHRKHVRIAVNAGLWLSDPDVDAMTRLANDIDVREFTREESYAMARGTWCPFNSQNTAMSRTLVEAYFLSPMIGRMDDIWGGYMVMQIMDHLGESIAFGFPIVNQERNPHNYFKDAREEEIGLQQTDRLCGWLREIKLTGQTYFDCMAELLPQLKAKIEAYSGKDFPEEHRTWLQDLIKGEEVWHKTIERARVIGKAKAE